MQISKTIRISEFRSVDIRAEAFNAFNHVQFYGPASVDAVVNNSNFGSVVSAAVIQVAAKFHF
jgi:hypothetical protein